MDFFAASDSGHKAMKELERLEENTAAIRKILVELVNKDNEHDDSIVLPSEYFHSFRKNLGEIQGAANSLNHNCEKVFYKHYQK